MKNCYKFLPVFIFALLISTSSITAQKPLANLQWVDTLGHPAFQYPYISGVTDGSNFVLVENEYVTGHKQGFTIVKTSGSGSVVWQKQFSTTANDYATNLSIKSGYVYVSGFNYDSSTSTAIFNTIKFKENNGDTMWSRTYTGSYGGGAT